MDLINKNYRIRARAPLRLGLAGGGSDVSPFCDINVGFVLSAAINKYAYTSIEKISSNEIQFLSTDLNISDNVNIDDFNSPNNILKLHKFTYRKIINKFNDGNPIAIKVTTFCEAPIGSGLGSSSTIVVSMIKAYSELLNLHLSDYEIAKLAFDIERIDCNLNGGRQDQYSAAFGGFNFMEFYADNKAIINPLRIDDCVLNELEASILLFYTGVSRDSAKIISEQSENIVNGIDKTFHALTSVKQEALIMKEALLKGDFEGIVHSMHRGWESKKNSASSVSSKKIEDIFSHTLHAGAYAGKVSGAGGGGFMMFLVPVEKFIDIKNSLAKFGGMASNCGFSKKGAQSWKIN
jgi:D-glycero-alpha-D-manno-heptose-7-phosphate kinase